MNRVTVPCAQYIKEIGRGRDNPRDMSFADASALWAAVLDGRVSDLELGAVLIAMRIKGEAPDELSGFLAASDAQTLKLRIPDNAVLPPVVIPSYNGARNMPNLTPLLAILLARQGVPVLVHGKVGDRDAPNITPITAAAALAPSVPSVPGAPVLRTTSAEIFHAMGFHAARNADEVLLQLQRGEPAFLPAQIVNPPLARVLALRRVLGVRNSAHSLVKMLQPFDCPALRLASYTHPEYQQLLHTHYTRHACDGRGDVLLLRGTEGEVVANVRRMAQIDWIHAGGVETVVQAQSGPMPGNTILPAARDAATTAVWIQAVLSGERPVPIAIARQVDAILKVLQAMRARVADAAPSVHGAAA